MEKILVVEDDRAVQKALKRLFISNGYGVEIAQSGNEGIESFTAATPSAVVLDLRLPGMQGQEVCREIKSRAPSLPVVVLSASTDIVDKVLLLEIGADDYVTKPFSPRELLARVKASMRRANRSTAVPEMFILDDVSINFTKMELTRGSEELALTTQEFKVLKFFVQNQDRVVTREELLNE